MPARPGPRRARSPSAAWWRPRTPSIPACTRPTSAARWRSRCWAETDPTAVLDAGMKLSHFGGGGRAHSHNMRPPAEVMAAFAANKFLGMTTERRNQALRHPGRRQPFLLRRAAGLDGAGGARHPPRLAQAGRAALQGRHGPGGELSPPAVARDAGAQRLDSVRDRRRARLLGRAAAHPRVDQEEPLRHPRRTWPGTRRQGEGPLLERAQLRVPQERRPVLPRQGRHPGVGGLRRRFQRAHADPAQHGRAEF